MTIAEAREKCKTFVAKVPRDMLIISILVLASSASFGLGYLAGLNAGQGSDINPPSSAPSVDGRTTAGTAGKFVASKTGTKYYLPSCASSKRISAANRIWFDTKEEAQVAGYSPASNCKGL